MTLATSTHNIESESSASDPVALSEYRLYEGHANCNRYLLNIGTLGPRSSSKGAYRVRLRIFHRPKIRKKSSKKLESKYQKSRTEVLYSHLFTGRPEQFPFFRILAMISRHLPGRCTAWHTSHFNPKQGRLSEEFDLFDGTHIIHVNLNKVGRSFGFRYVAKLGKMATGTSGIILALFTPHESAPNQPPTHPPLRNQQTLAHLFISTSLNTTSCPSFPNPFTP